jgi:geranylgeranyl reductase family protein
VEDPGPVWDVAVVGGGPAGSAAALAVLRARPGARVLVLDAGGPGRDKTCGDAVAAETFDLAAGLGLPDLGAGYPAVARLRVIGPAGRSVTHPPARPARIIPRRIFDDRLARAAVAAGAVGVHDRIRTVEPGTGLAVAVGRRTRTAARIVIGADGAHSTVRRAVGLPHGRPERTGIALRAYADDVYGEQLLVSVADGWPAYAWSFPIGDGRANIGFGVRLDRLPAGVPGWLRRRLHELLPAAAATLDERSVRTAHLPFVTGRVHQPDGRVLLAGDAAALVDPLTGEGIWYAVASGRLAGLAAAAGLASTPSRAGGLLRRSLRRELGLHLALAGIAGAATGAHPRLVDLAVDATVTDGRAFDELTRFSLAGGLPGPRLLGRLAAGSVRTLLR